MNKSFLRLMMLILVIKLQMLMACSRSTLKERFSGRVSHGTKPGPVKYEELLLVDFLIKCAMGYGKTRRDVCGVVESYLGRKDTK